MTDHERWEDAAGSYVLNALTDEERVGYEAHLATCAECRAEVAELRMAADALPVSPPPMLPPPALKARIMAEVEREASLLAAAGPEADRPPAAPERRRRFTLRVPRLVPSVVAAALLVIGIAIGVGAAALRGEPERTVTAQVSGAPGASLQVELSGHEGRLTARGLPAPPRGRVYQVWLKREGHAAEPTAAMFLPSRDGAATASVPGSMEGVDQVMITDEPDGGSPQPTGRLLAVADLS